MKTVGVDKLLWNNKDTTQVLEKNNLWYRTASAHPGSFPCWNSFLNVCVTFRTITLNIVLCCIVMDKLGSALEVCNVVMCKWCPLLADGVLSTHRSGVYVHQRLGAVPMDQEEV